MKRNVVLAVIAAAFSASPLFSANPPIGIASAAAIFSANDAPVNGSIDVADGTELRTTISPSDIHLENGVDLRLATRSAGIVFADHLLLKDGAVRVSNFNTYTIQARQLQVTADAPETEAVVRVKGHMVEVASIGGTLNIADGGALTRVAAGTKMSFQSTGADAGQSGATAAQTGAAPAEKGPFSDKKAILWAAGVCAVAAIVIGSIAAAQGKSPF